LKVAFNTIILILVHIGTYITGSTVLSLVLNHMLLVYTEQPQRWRNG
jgi:hypothetical protein